MKTSFLVTLSLAAAFACVATVVGCSDPDVTPFTGASADTAGVSGTKTPGDDDDDSSSGDDDDSSLPSLGDDDDDSTGTSSSSSGGHHHKDGGAASSSSSSSSSGSTGTADDDDDSTTTTTTGSSSGGTLTGGACFTHCVSTEASAANLDACSNKCADGDTDCLSTCYDNSGCANDNLCQAALDQCDGKCFPSSS